MSKLYCGIDIHYNRSYFNILNEKGKEVILKEVETKREEIMELLNAYRGYDMSYAFEAGGMARYFHNILSQQPNTKKIHVVHPLKFKVITESKRKNDKKDCQELAMALLKDYLPLPVHIKNEYCYQLQTLLNLRERYVRTRTKIVSQAKSILRSRGIRVKRFSLKNNSRFEVAICSLNEHEFEQGILKELQREFQAETEKKDAIELRILQLIEQHFKEEYKLLDSIPGIGFVTAAAIISKVDKIERFERAGQLSSYFGLVPSEHSSAEKVYHGRITKTGAGRVRSLLIQSAWTVLRVKNNGDERLSRLKKKYYRMAFKEKNSQKAITALARQLSRIVFGVLRHKVPYRGKITEAKYEACTKSVAQKATEEKSKVGVTFAHPLEAQSFATERLKASHDRNL